ncbi:CCA tRNA nucleotidyltransferase [Sphingomicrobium clamense]|uniref:CCA tRNA nucleotidyltransferase n=1 Tax=Sphingomicrobium clamense TaxID=2851013 RepID=A0ABS6V794_9SPHN|nr:CCA tRNA nucleotidyltransferase [Sphingomicrobium sp. B8]MBW0145442.1 CCA tRNA nucleotidyltransferase [Sphingomicrobium sp. B8]
MARLLSALGEEEGAVRFVGGCVRDQLLGLDSADIDLATTHDPHEVVRRLEAKGIKAIPTGIEHGTITAVSDHTVVEVTTLRSDVSTDGRRATVAFTDDWKEDAARRDFTFNALFADPLTGEISDYFGGLDDLEARRVRFIGTPEARIEEDHLRILRFFRFHARFGEGEPDAEGLEACARKANNLMALSRERIADELLKLLALPRPGDTVALMHDKGIFTPVLPEIDADGVGRLKALVWTEAETNLDPHPIRRLAALLPADPAIAREVAGRLKLSKAQRQRLVLAATAHEGTQRALAYRRGRDAALDALALVDDRVGMADVAEWEIPVLPIKGGDLIERGIKKGPQVAKTLRALEEEWIRQGFPEGTGFNTLLQSALDNS